MIIFPILAQTGQYNQHNSIYWLLIIQWIVPIIFLLVFFIPLVICIWRATKYFGNATKEQKLLRIEMGKLSEEVHLLRQEINSDEKRVTAIESG